MKPRARPHAVESVHGQPSEAVLRENHCTDGEDDVDNEDSAISLNDYQVVQTGKCDDPEASIRARSAACQVGILSRRPDQTLPRWSDNECGSSIDIADTGPQIGTHGARFSRGNRNLLFCQRMRT